MTRIMLGLAVVVTWLGGSVVVSAHHPFSAIYTVDQVYNLLDAAVSDIDYYFASRLPGEPLEGVNDIHFHPAVPRTARLSVIVGF